MKIRSLLLGSVAAAGLATGAYASDMSVFTSLDALDAFNSPTITADEPAFNEFGLNFDHDGMLLGMFDKLLYPGLRWIVTGPGAFPPDPANAGTCRIVEALQDCGLQVGGVGG